MWRRVLTYIWITTSLNFLGQIFILGRVFPAASSSSWATLPTHSFFTSCQCVSLFRKHKLHEILVFANSERKTNLLAPLPTNHLKLFRINFRLSIALLLVINENVWRVTYSFGKKDIRSCNVFSSYPTEYINQARLFKTPVILFLSFSLTLGRKNHHPDVHIHSISPGNYHWLASG